MSVMKSSKVKHGDTLVEVIIALAIFATLAVMAIHTMNVGMEQAERSLEITMARNEIDAQAEAIRFIQNNYVAEREHQEAKQQYSALWRKIVNTYTIAANGGHFKSEDYDINNQNIKTCNDAYDKQMGGSARNGANRQAFAINTRLLEPSTGLNKPPNAEPDPAHDYTRDLLPLILIDRAAKNGNEYILRPAKVYPRGIYSTLKLGYIDDTVLGGISMTDDTETTLAETQIYRKLQWLEGVWVVAVGGDNTNIIRSTNNFEFFDFYIRTCWQAVGLDAPSTLTTIVRLYNPEVIE